MSGSVGSYDILIADCLLFLVSGFIGICATCKLLQIWKRITGMLYIIQEAMRSHKGRSIANSSNYLATL